jgi:1-deoxy-D-xylulose-5-phosphate synthase
MLSNIPNLVYLAPTCKQEFLAMLDWSIEQNEYPVAIRVPGNDVIDNPSYKAQDFSKLNKFSVNQKGEKVAIIAEGTFYELGEKVAKRLEKETGIKPTLINPVFLTGIDEQVLEGLKSKHSLVITLEDGSLDGGFGGKIASFYGASDVKVINYGIKKAFYDRFDPDELLKQNRLDVDDIVEDVKGIVG